MTQGGKGDKGYRLEELLRAYFLRAGFFVVRSVPFQDAGDDLTDIDLWLYERPTGLPAAARLSMLSRGHGPKPSSGCCGRRGWPSS